MKRYFLLVAVAVGLNACTIGSPMRTFEIVSRGAPCDVIAEAYSNRSLLERNSSYRQIFQNRTPTHRAGVPTNARIIRAIEEYAGRMNGSEAVFGWEYELQALLALSRYFSARADHKRLMQLTDVLLSHPVFAVDPQQQTYHDLAWEDTLAWMARNAFRADHYLERWLLTRDTVDLEVSVNAVGAYLRLMNQAENDALPRVFRSYWNDNQAYVANSNRYKYDRYAARTILVAKQVDPALLLSAGIAEEDVVKVLGIFSGGLKSTLQFAYENLEAIMNDEYLPHHVDSLSVSDSALLAEPLVTIAEANFWKALLVAAETGATPTFDRTRHFVGIDRCYKEWASVLSNLKSIALGTFAPAGRESASRNAGLLQQVMQLYSGDQMLPLSAQNKEFLGFARLQSVIQRQLEQHP